MRPALEERELENRHGGEQREQHHRQRCRVRRVPEPETDLEDVIEQQLGRVVGTAARHHDDVVDDAKRVDHRVDQHEQRRRHQQRQRDAAEEVAARSAFDGRHVGKIRRHRLQRREVEDHEKASFLPYGDDHQRRQRRTAAAEPVVARQPEEPGDLLEEAIAGRIEEEPDVRDGDHRQHRRREVGEPQESASREVSVHPDGHQQRERDRQRNRAERVPEVVRERLPEDRVVDQRAIIVEADECRRVRAPWRRIKAVPEVRDRRIVCEQREQRRRRQQQQPGVDPLARSRHRSFSSPRSRREGA